MLVYLAAPYSNVTNKEEHMETIMRLSGEYMLKHPGEYVCSPLFNHFSLRHCPNLGTDWAFWAGYSEHMLGIADKLLVVEMAGTYESTGVLAEIKIAGRLKKPILLWNQTTGEITVQQAVAADHLSVKEIAARIRRFNENGDDWSAFDDVPVHQQIDVLYPHMLNHKEYYAKIDKGAERTDELSKWFVSQVSAIEKSAVTDKLATKELLNRLYNKFSTFSTQPKA